MPNFGTFVLLAKGSLGGSKSGLDSLWPPQRRKVDIQTDLSATVPQALCSGLCRFLKLGVAMRGSEILRMLWHILGVFPSSSGSSFQKDAASRKTA